MPPLQTNPLISRADLQQAVLDLCSPVLDRLSPAGARVTMDGTGVTYGPVAASLEAFARPLWGLAPLAAGGGNFAQWHRIREGLVAGTDPAHPEYWGPVTDRDQRMVEMAAIGFAIHLVPQHLWDPLPTADRDRIARWLDQINHHEANDNNWRFFRTLVNLGLGRQNPPEIEDFYLGDGWYSDGKSAQRDYYVPFAMHFYSLICRLPHAKERAAAFAKDFVHWFAADGSALPFGRSLTYRFAQAAFWGALAFAGIEALPWSVLKGLWLRHLRWWSRQPILTHNGILTIGYRYPNLNLAEEYNSPASPYWSLKFFLPLALPPEHPFWTAEEDPIPELPPVTAQPHAGMVLFRDSQSRQVVALSGGQHALWVRHGAEKYAKFAYSTAFGFSVPSGRYGLEQAAADSVLALSTDGNHYAVREKPVASRTGGIEVWTRWEPLAGVTVQTWLIAAPPWHLRIHCLQTTVPVLSAEGGFAIDRHYLDPPTAHAQTWAERGLAAARTPTAGTGILDLRPLARRAGRIVFPHPNTNVLSNRTALPTLAGHHDPGEHWLACAVLADPDPSAWKQAWATPPATPDLTQLGAP